MRTKTPRTKKLASTDVEVRSASANVFADLGLSDAGDRLAKAELAHEICGLIRSAKLTQVQAARRLGIDQPKVSALMCGRLREFSIERLIRFATRLGRDVVIHLRAPMRRGQTSIHVSAEA